MGAKEENVLYIFLKVNLLKMSCCGNYDEMETRIGHSLKAAGGGGREDEARVLISENVPEVDNKKEERAKSLLQRAK